MQKKVYEYNKTAVQTKIIKAFRSHGREATVVDIVSQTGLPVVQVEEQLREVSDEYGSRLKVTESGELLYSFPRGFRSRYKGLGPSLKRFWAVFKKGAMATLKLLFKIWIVVMLVGYFLVFLAIAILALVLSLAGNKDSNSGGSRGGGGLFLGARMLDLFVQLWLYSKVTKAINGMPQPKKRPLHKGVFSFVFGDGNPNLEWDEIERRATLSYIQSHKGIISLEEYMIISGKGPQEAEEAFTRYLLEFEGSPEVSESGSIYYSFPNIMRRADASYGSTQMPKKKLRAFSSNEKKLNRGIALLNGFNIVFGAYFLITSLLYVFDPSAATWVEAVRTQRGTINQEVIHFLPGAGYLYSVAVWALWYIGAGVAQAADILRVGLGYIPLIFSALFYLIPAVRKSRIAKENEAIKLTNLRMATYKRVWDNPNRFLPASVAPSAIEASPKDFARARDKVVSELAAAKGGEPVKVESISSSQDAEFAYDFPDIARERADLEAIRAKIDGSKFAIGKTVFDSDAKGDA